MTFVEREELKHLIDDTYNKLMFIQVFILLSVFALAVFFWWDTEQYIATNRQLIYDNKQLIQDNKELARENQEILKRLDRDIEVLKKNDQLKRTK